MRVMASTPPRDTEESQSALAAFNQKAGEGALVQSNRISIGFVFAGLAFLALALTACDQSEATSAPPSPTVSVAKAIKKDIAHWDEFPGRVEATEMVQIRPRVSGYIESVNFDEGAEVKKGDVLFVIDQRSYRAELARAEASLARARTQAELAEAQAVRARKLLEAKAISREEYDERIAAEAQGNSDVSKAEADVAVARLNLDFTEIRSPIDGRAGRALITQGNLVSAESATLLTTVVSIDSVYVTFNADEQAYLRYASLANANSTNPQNSCLSVIAGLANEEGFPHTGCLDFMDNQLDPATGTIRARALLGNDDRIFTPGLFARVKLMGRNISNALLIDEKSVMTDQDRRYIYVLDADNRAVRRDVKLGQTNGALRVVTDGLTEDDLVVVYGTQKIFMPGMVVDPQTITMGEQPPSAPNLMQQADASDKSSPASQAR